MKNKILAPSRKLEAMRSLLFDTGNAKDVQMIDKLVAIAGSPEKAIEIIQACLAKAREEGLIPPAGKALTGMTATKKK